jgi:hypothetical protein
MDKPRFYQGQRVCFVGGEGLIKDYQPEAGTWAYQVKMTTGQEPNFGRLGHETTVVLAETELKPLKTGECSS